MTSPKAVIEIGSTGIRLLVADMATKARAEKQDPLHNVLDRAELPLSIGREVFTSGSISRETQVQCVRILNLFKEQIASWGIQAQEAMVIATSAVREAINKDPFVDRIKVKTGFTVRVIDGIEENRLMYMAVTSCLKDENIDVKQENYVILEIAGGATEIILMEKGRMVGAHSLRLGTVIIEQQIYAMRGTLDDEHRFEDARRFLEEFISNTHGVLKEELNIDSLHSFITLGTDMKIAALHAGTCVTPFLWAIRRSDFDTFVENVLKYPVDLIITKFKLSYAEAQTFQLSLLAYRQFIKVTNIDSILVPEVSLRDGLLISCVSDKNKELQKEFAEQIVASAATLLRKYRGDEKHAQYVRTMCLRIYNSMQNEADLSPKARLLLEVSALLHDVGMFIRAEDHNAHSKYIIQHSEIFGLSKEEINIVALTAYYHKGTKLPQEDSDFLILQRSDRMLILKLAAILRVADALDRSHKQKLTDFTIDFVKDSLTFRIKTNESLSLEKLAMAEKGGLFESVFGYKIVLL